MKLLIDTNIILEVLLGQTRAGEARALLARTGEHEFFLTDFALHSIGLLLFRQQRSVVFTEFLRDWVMGASVRIARLAPADSLRLAEFAQQHRLDFDDAYQAVAAEKYQSVLVSFNADFDRTPRGRKTPADLPA